MTIERLAKRLISLRTMKKEVRAKDVHKLLLDDTIWFSAYQNIYGNKGAFTEGTDNADTINNFNKERINKIISSLKDMSYQCKPSRRINIPKANGKLRPLSIPCGTDKLVQEACRIILEAIYESKFSDSSHGFRPGRSCHTALKKVSAWTSTKWWLEFDIKGCFDNIDHNILISILEEKIDDKKFIGLIRKFLNAGYIENWKYQNTYSGTPQGGGISPILANICLNKLDEYIDNICEEINSSEKSNNINIEYRQLKNIVNNGKVRLELYKEKYNQTQIFIKEHIKWDLLSNEVKSLYKECFNLKKEKRYNTILERSRKIGKLTGLNKKDIYNSIRIHEYQQKINETEVEINNANIKLKNVRATEINEKFERLHYVRYADDFLLGFIGKKVRAEEIFKNITEYLNKLKLETSSEKSRIVFGNTGVIFLGYRIEMPTYTESKVKYTNSNGTEVLSYRALGRPLFKVPVERAISFVKNHDYGSYVENESVHRSALQNFDDIEILKQYNAELRGLAQYYKHAMNFKHIIGKVQWIWQYSFLKTIAAKHRCSVAKTFKLKHIKTKLDKNAKSKIWYIEVNKKEFEVFNIRNIDYINMFEVDANREIPDISNIWKINLRSSALRKLITDECEICGIKNTETNIILHHPNQIKNIPSGITYWERMKRIRNRKTIAVCHNCHMKFHHG